MKKNCTLILMLLAFTGTMFAQEEMKIKIGGFVRYEAYYDTYSSAVTRDGELYLFPKAAELDINGIDLNDYPTLNMLSLVSRFNIKASGPEILGAKSSALLEADFFGTAQDYSRLLRLRHAYMKLNWEQGELLMGHAFHPMTVTQCLPGTVTFAIGVPFNPLNRSSQIRGTLKPTEDLSLIGALLMHTYHRSSGPINAQRNSGVPDMELQFQYAPGNFLIGGTVGYKKLKPRLSTTLNLASEQSIGSTTFQGFLKYTKEKFSFKAMSVYGGNLTNLISIGGYGTTQHPSVVDDYAYSNMQTITFWTDITLFKNPQIGLFGGYAENLGSQENYFPLTGYGRVDNMAKTYRISPRVNYKVKNLTLSMEVLYAVAIYGDTFNANYKALTYEDPTTNYRFIFASKYSF